MKINYSDDINATDVSPLVLTLSLNIDEDSSSTKFLKPSEHHEHPASFEAQVAVSVVIGILGVWSTSGNSLTIMAISMHKNIMTKCNYFILSLAISDLISGAIASPLWLYRRTWGFEDWLWGDFLCKLFWFVDEFTSYCTAMHIASFAVWRYIGVKWPHWIERLKNRVVVIWISVIWCTAIVFGGIVFSTFYGVEDRSLHAPEVDFTRWPACSILTANNGIRKHLIYYTFSSATFMLLPMMILFASSILIIRELFWFSHVKSPTRRAKERRAVCQLALISASFLVGYVPMTIYVMWTTRTPKTDYRVDYWTHVASYFCLRTSECLNPIIYNIASTGMRKASKQVLHYIRNCCRSDTEIDFISHSHACSQHHRVRPMQKKLLHIVDNTCAGTESGNRLTFSPTNKRSNPAILSGSNAKPKKARKHVKSTKSDEFIHKESPSRSH